MSNSVPSKAGWTRVALGDVVDVVTDYWDRNPSVPERFVAGEHIDEGDLRVRRWGMTTDELVPPTFNRRFRAGDVLFHSRNLKKLARPNFAGITGEKLFVLRSKDSSHLLPELVPFILQTQAFGEYVNLMWAGSTNKFLNKAPLLRFEVPLPPLPEQERIRDACQAAAMVVDTMSYTKEAGERARKAFLIALFQQGVHQEAQRTTPIGPVPKSWEVVPLGDRYQVQLGKMVSDAVRGGPGQVPYLRNANVQWNRLELDDVATMSLSAREREKYSLHPGDILACEGRHVGKSALWRNEIPGATFQKALHRLRRLSDRDVPEYLLHCLQYYSWTGRFIIETGETTIPHLPAERLRAMLFPFPPPAEQEEIAEAIRTYDDGLSVIEGRVAQSRRLLSELIQRLAAQ